MDLSSVKLVPAQLPGESGFTQHCGLGATGLLAPSDEAEEGAKLESPQRKWNPICSEIIGDGTSTRCSDCKESCNGERILFICDCSEWSKASHRRSVGLTASLSRQPATS